MSDNDPIVNIDWHDMPSPPRAVFAEAHSQHRAHEDIERNTRFHRVYDLLRDRMPGKISSSLVAAAADIVDSDDMLVALGFDRRWEYGSPHDPWSADDERDAHRLAARKPEQNGGYVHQQWVRDHQWVVYDPDLVAAADKHDAALRSAKQRRDAVIAVATAAAERGFEEDMRRINSEETDQ